MARAVAADPDLLLMDEPFGALDPGTREAIQDEFLRLNSRLRKTVVLVTHDIAEAGKLADEIVVLDTGRLAQRGTLRDLLMHPANDRVRAFLGSRAQELALGGLKLEQFLDELTPQAPSLRSLALAGNVSIGQVLLALADSQEGDTVTVDRQPARTFSAKTLLARILGDLRPPAEKR